MIIIQLTGGLGNQMFQYAFAKSLAHDLNTNFLIDTEFYNTSTFKIKFINFLLKIGTPLYKIACRLSLRINSTIPYPPNLKYMQREGHEFYNLGCFNIDSSCLNKEYLNEIRSTALKNQYNEGLPLLHPQKIDLKEIKMPSYFKGVYQFEEYFIHNEDLIRNDFEFITPLIGKNKEIADDIKEHNSIAIHIRRGDFFKAPTHSLVTMNYYEKSIEYIAKNVENPKFFIFSNDPEWVKENIKIPHDTYYVTNNSSEKGYEDMRLMSLCDHFIIANSTFSWWGAWLSKNKDKIVIKPEPGLISRIAPISQIKSKKCVSIENDYKDHFNDSDIILAHIDYSNIKNSISKIKNIKMDTNNNQIKLTSTKNNSSLFKNSKLFLKDIQRLNPENWSVLKLSFNCESNDSLQFFYLTKDSNIYNILQRFPIHYEENDDLEIYIPISPEILLNGLILVPFEKVNSTINIKSIEIREIKKPKEFN